MSVTFRQDPVDRRYTAIVTDVRDQPSAFAASALGQCVARSIKFLYVARSGNPGAWFQALAVARLKQLFTADFKLAQVAGGALVGGALESEPSEAARQMKLQLLISELQRTYELITNLQKCSRDLQMIPIRNLRG